MGNLSVSNQIECNDILDVKILKDGKIFLLTGKDGAQLVLKGEPNVTGSKIVKTEFVVEAIDPGIRMRPLTSTEVKNLEAACDSQTLLFKTIEKNLGRNVSEIQNRKVTWEEFRNFLTTFGKVGDGSCFTDIAKMSHIRMQTLGMASEIG